MPGLGPILKGPEDISLTKRAMKRRKQVLARRYKKKNLKFIKSVYLKNVIN